MTQNAKLAAGLGIIRAILDTIKETGRTPRGVLYAALMQHGATMEHYQQIERVILGTKLVRAENDCLVWVGPQA